MRAMMIAIWIAAAMWLNTSVASPHASYFFFEDTSNQMDVAAVSNQPFTPLNSNILNVGFTSSGYWIKVIVNPHRDNELFLSISPANMTDVQAFRLNGTRWEEITQNNPTLAVDSIYYKKNEIFLIPANSESETLLLKVNTKTIVFAVFNLDTREALFNKLTALTGGLNLYLGAALSFCLFLIALGIYHRDVFMLASLLATIQFVFYRISLAGASFINPQFEGLTNLQTLNDVLLPVTSCLYLLALLHTHNIAGSIKKLTLWLTGISIVLVVMFLISQENVYLKWGAYWSFLPVILLIFTACNPSTNRLLGVGLSVSIIVLGFSILISKLTQIGSLPSVFNTLLTPSLHIPIFILLTIVAFSKVKKNQESKEKSQQFFLAKAYKETENVKLQKDQQHKFLLMLTHELKNSLSVLRLYLQLPRDHQQYSSFAEQSILDMDTIIERCAQLDQLEREEIKLHHSTFDLNELIKQIINNNINKDRLVFDNQCTKTVIKTDLTLTRTIINNLIENALKYSVPETHVIMIIRNTSDGKLLNNVIRGLTFSIRNQVAPKDLPDQSLIFTKYYRGSMSNRLTGSGLGLYIVQALSKMLNGELTYLEHDKEVMFKLWLPI